MPLSEKQVLDEIERRKQKALSLIKDLQPALLELRNEENWKYHGQLSGLTKYSSPGQNSKIFFEIEGIGKCAVLQTSSELLIRVGPGRPEENPVMLHSKNGQVYAFLDGDWPKHILNLAVQLPSFREKARRLTQEFERKQGIENAAKAFGLESPYPPPALPEQPQPHAINEGTLRDLKKRREFERNGRLIILAVIAVLGFLVWVAYTQAR